jgi:hypothetical protein
MGSSGWFVGTQTTAVSIFINGLLREDTQNEREQKNGTEFRYSYSVIRFLQATEQSSVGRSTWLPELCSGEY